MQTRRQFLKQIAATAALAALPVPLRAMQGTLRPGFSLYGMKKLPLEEALQSCAGIGYREIELALNPGFPTEPKLLSAGDRVKLRQRIESLQLTVAGLMCNISLATDEKAQIQNIEVIKAAAQLAHDLAPASPPLLETVLGGKPADWDQLKDRMAANLQAWAEAATAGKIILTVKAHVGSAVTTPERLLWLLEKVNRPAIQVAYDHSHFELQGIPMAESLKMLLPHTRFIHLKDASGDAKKYQFLLPGEGQTDYAAYFKLLKQQNYTGPMIVEVSGQIFNKPDYDPIAAARKCYTTLTTALAQA